MGKPKAGGVSRAASKAGSDNAKEFNSHFASLYGERWAHSLKGALLEPSHLLALQNSFTQQDLATEGSLEPWVCSDGCKTFRRTETKGPYPQPCVDGKTGLAGWYWLDAASLLPPLLLNVHAGMSALDMCASPGGKSVVIAQQLWAQAQRASAVDAVGPEPASPPAGSDSCQAPALPNQQCSEAATPEPESQGAAAAAAHGTSGPMPEVAGHLPSAPSHAVNTPGHALLGSGSLTCNEPDAKRRQRLQQVLQEYLPAPLMTKVRITGHEGDKYWQRGEAETYDRVLIDAPCSSDRHILQQSASNRGAIPEAYWSVKRCKKASDLQLQLLLAGLKALKVGGRLVYATCSMSSLENDQVVERALARVGERNVQVLSLLENSDSLSQEYLKKLGAERTKFGVICLPDSQGWGPIYACVLDKCASITKTTIPVSVLACADPEQESDDEEVGTAEGAAAAEQITHM